MLRKRAAEHRGITETDWLTSYHTFSFNRYRDPDWNRFHSLRVVNQDTVTPGHGFDTHSHSNMEILTYVVDGVLWHEDSTGTDDTVASGEVQRMTAGTGVLHSEYNDSDTDRLQFYQIWIEPESTGLKPGYETMQLDAAEGRQVQCIASPEEGRGMHINQDAAVFHVSLPRDTSWSYRIDAGRGLWVQVVDGDLTVETGEGNVALEEGDGLAVEDVEQVVFRVETDTVLLLFDLA